MSAILWIVDETTTGAIVQRRTLTLPGTRLTARSLIELRVRDEVARFNADEQILLFQGLVQPTDTERELNGFRLRKRRPLDPDAQCSIALEQFARNGFFMLANGRQIESLDEEIAVTADSAVSFVKLVPLVGG
jgi:hypothetical protein